MAHSATFFAYPPQKGIKRFENILFAIACAFTFGISLFLSKFAGGKQNHLSHDKNKVGIIGEPTILPENYCGLFMFYVIFHYLCPLKIH